MASTPILSIDTATGHSDEATHAQTPQPLPAPSCEDMGGEDVEEQEVALGGGLAALVPPALAIALAAGWSVLFLTANHSAMAAGGSAAQWGNWLLQWSGPATLVAVVYLIWARSSRREAERFVDAAHALRRESLALETRLTSVNRELSLAREFLAAQGRDLDSMGRIAVERIGEHATRLETLVRDNSTQVETLGSVSAAALENMEQLRDHLPVINNVAKDVASNIGNVGRVSQAHLQDMVKGLTRLNDFGQASERQVASLRERIDDALAALEARTQQLDTVITGRFEALDERSSGFAIDLERHESESREALRQRAAAMSEEIAATRVKLDHNEADALTSLRARLTALRDEGANLSRALREGESGALGEWQANIARLSETLATFDAEVAARHTRAIENAARLGSQTEATTLRLAQAEARIEALTIADNGVAAAMETRLDTLERRLSDTDTSLERLTDSSVRLLELIQSSAQHSREQLPAALKAAEDRLTAHEARLRQLRIEVEATTTSSAALAEHVGSAQQGLKQANGEITALHDGVSAQIENHAAALSELRVRLAEAEADALRLAAHAQGALQDAMASLAQASRDAVQTLETDGAAHVQALADQLSTASGDVLERSMRLKAGEIAGRLEQAAAHAIGVSGEAAEQLARRMAEVDALAANLEARVHAARDAAEDKIDHDFTRRMATITDTLQSAAVDIASALDTEVADTAWAAYLRGDRGIFARRAVRLLSATDAKSVLALYEADGAFQSQVNRYIHDFEAMLRHLLATRDGHAVSVTLLSSDMGKVYVALAQAIERLRD